ncbi:MAG: hypothetical protein WB820_12530 [Rhodoplanes sp.]
MGHRGYAYVGARLDVVDRSFLQRHDAPAIGESHGRFVPITRLERDRLAVDLGDLAAEPNCLLSLSDDGQGREHRQGNDDRARRDELHRVFLLRGSEA